MFQFAKEDKNTVAKLDKERWKILIVDDEPEVHNITKSVLKKFIFDNKGLNFLSAYSGTEALKILVDNDDIALVLLDVVMETDDAGLKVVRAIREDFDNHIVRIVLRTGQPGNAPMTEIILDYEIDDYKDKTELTSDKLFVTVVSALRSVKNIKKIRDDALKQREFKTKVRSAIVTNNEKNKELENKINTLKSAMKTKGIIPKEELKLYIERIHQLEDIKKMQSNQIKAYEAELIAKETMLNDKNKRLKQLLFKD